LKGKIPIFANVNCFLLGNSWSRSCFGKLRRKGKTPEHSERQFSGCDWTRATAILRGTTWSEYGRRLSFRIRMFFDSYQVSISSFSNNGFKNLHRFNHKKLFEFCMRLTYSFNDCMSERQGRQEPRSHNIGVPKIYQIKKKLWKHVVFQ